MKNIKNKVQLIGNLGNDPILKALGTGKKVARFSLATSESYTNKNGEKVSNAQWHNIVAWENLAEISVKYLKKEDQVAVDGKITYREYESEKGERKYLTEIVANEILILSSKKNSSD